MTDGTLIEHLPGVFTHVAEAELDERLRLDLTHSISSYCTLVAQATSKQIINAISTAFKGKEYLDMIETIKNNIMLDGIAIGEARGKAEEKIDIARNMKRKEYPMKDIADLTGLPFSEIERLGCPRPYRYFQVWLLAGDYFLEVPANPSSRQCILHGL